MHGFVAASRVRLALVALALTSCAGEKVRVFAGDAALPPAYPIAAAAVQVERAALGTTVTTIYSAPITAAALRAEQTKALERSPWRFTVRGDRLESVGPGYRVVATIKADGDNSQLSIEIVTGEAPAPPEAPPLLAPPPSYPKGFPFVKGGVLVKATPSGVEIDYRDQSRATLAKSLRERAERARWMCTQGDKRFLCAVGARNVDVTLWRKGSTLRLVVTDVGPSAP